MLALQEDIDKIDMSVRAIRCIEADTRRAATPLASSSAASAAATTFPFGLSLREVKLLELEALTNAHIVFTTLSGAGEGLRLAEVRGGFETVIFDEAAQVSIRVRVRVGVSSLI